jgi:hypothetical protein
MYLTSILKGLAEVIVDIEMESVLYEAMLHGSLKFREASCEVLLSLCDIDDSFLPLDSPTLELFNSFIPALVEEENELHLCYFSRCVSIFVAEIDPQLLIDSAILKNCLLFVRSNYMARCLIEIVQDPNHQTLTRHLIDAGLLTFFINALTKNEWHELEDDEIAEIKEDVKKAIRSLLAFDPKCEEEVAAMELPSSLKDDFLFRESGVSSKRKRSELEEEEGEGEEGK